MGQKRFKLSVQSQKKVLNENLKEVPNTNYRCGLGYSLTVRLKIIDYNSRNKDQIATQQKISDSNEIRNFGVKDITGNSCRNKDVSEYQNIVYRSVVLLPWPREEDSL